MSTTIQFRRDSAANWAADNPILADGEEGIERDTGKSKIGDGTTHWNSLPYEYSGTFAPFANPHIDSLRNTPRWSPPAQVHPTVYTAANSFLNITAGPNEDVIIYGRASAANGSSVVVTGGRHVRFVGGKYAKTSTGATFNVSNVTGSVSFEGIEIDSSGYNGDAINACGVSSGNQTYPDVYIQKCRIYGVNGTSATVHADVFQPQGPMGRLFIDLLTFSSNYQGLFLAPDFATGGVYISRTNGTKVVNGANPITYMLWFNDGTENPYPVILDEVYVTGPNGQSLASNWIWPNAGLTGSGGSINGIAIGAVDNGDGSASWPIAMQIDGKVYSGSPANGDFCPAGSVGIGYVAKNYLASATSQPPAVNGKMAQWGVQSEPYPVAVATNSTILTSGRMEGALIPVTPGMALTGIVIGLQTNAASLDALYVGAYQADSVGTNLVPSPQNQLHALDSGTATTGSLIKLPFYSNNATITIPAGVYAIYSVILAHGTTPPALCRAGATGFVGGVNGGLPLFVFNTGNTVLVSGPVVPANWNQENQSYWIGVY